MVYSCFLRRYYMLIINQLKVSINDNTDDLSNAISKKLRISVEDLIKYEIAT